MSLRIITLNLNGIRAARRKGFFDWVTQQNADIICLQETRAHMQQLYTSGFKVPRYEAYFHDAEKKGYSGTGIYTRIKPNKVTTGLGWNVADAEGRYIQLDFQNLSVASLYMPSGTSGEQRQTLKYEFMDYYLPKLQTIANSAKNFIICGDLNIAHKPIDLKNWRGNRQHSGFLPIERAWLDKIVDDLGWVDAFRELNKTADQYTWWSNFGKAWDRNVGWRIDYQLVTHSLKDKILAVDIYKTERFSDHAPVIVDYDMNM